MITIKEALDDASLSLEDEVDYADMTEEEYKQEIERLNNIIKEVRELLESKKHCERLFGGVEGKSFIEQALEILDKGE